MDADDLAVRYGLYAERICVAELSLVDKGELLKILLGLYLGDAHFSVDFCKVIIGFEDSL